MENLNKKIAELVATGHRRIAENKASRNKVSARIAKFFAILGDSPDRGNAVNLALRCAKLARSVAKDRSQS